MTFVIALLRFTLGPMKSILRVCMLTGIGLVLVLLGLMALPALQQGLQPLQAIMQVLCSNCVLSCSPLNLLVCRLGHVSSPISP